MSNPSGSNGHASGVCPPDDELKVALMQYARERLPLAKRILRLHEEFNYTIGMGTLKRLQKKFDIPTVRKPPSRPMATTLICQKMAEDVKGTKGPNTIQKMLAKEGHLIPRSVVREVMADNDPTGADRRFPGRCHNKIVEHTLTASSVQSEGTS